MQRSVTTGPVELFCDARAVLAESIVWDPDAGVLRWCDITPGRLQSADPGGTLLPDVEVSPPFASFQLRRDGGFVAALADVVVLTDGDGILEREIARIDHPRPDMRCNEGKCDPFGRFLVGSMSITTDLPVGTVSSVEPDGTVRVLRGGFGTANGIDWSLDGTTMYVTDTGTSTVYRGSYGPDGVLGELNPVISAGSHDGLVRDDEDCIWTALNGAGRVERYSPTGEHLETVEVPVPNVTSLAFGGPDLSTLFIASARENLTEEALATAPTSGGIFAVPTQVQGGPARRFGA